MKIFYLLLLFLYIIFALMLVSIQQYADRINVTRAAIHSRRRNRTIEFVKRHGLYYIDTDVYPIEQGKVGRPSAAKMLLRRQKPYTKTIPK